MIHKLGELFAGPGGLGLGAKLAIVKTKNQIFKIEHAWATDFDKDSCQTFTNNICPKKPETVICKDIRKLDFQELKNISDIEGLSFGFPCNDFSAVGERKGINGSYGPLYTYGIKALQIFRPIWFLAENVGGLRNSNEGKAFKIILTDLYNAGYSIYPHLYKFEQYGIPQTRHRIIIVGIRKDFNKVFKIPSPEPYKHINNTAKYALEIPPIDSDTPNNEYTKQSEVVVERLKYIKPGQNAFTADIPHRLKLKVNGAKISQIYRRLDPDKPAYTVTGSGGGGTHVYHWEEPRALTNRERARLQTFPDDFVFYGSKESVRKQIGMAVPVKGAKIIFEAILRTFADINYPSITPNISSMIHIDNVETFNKEESTKQYILFDNQE